MSAGPKNVTIHFVKNEINTTNIGEPPYPLIFGVVANILFKTRRERHSEHPLFGNK